LAGTSLAPDSPALKVTALDAFIEPQAPKLSARAIKPKDKIFGVFIMVDSFNVQRKSLPVNHRQMIVGLLEKMP
jgi:hypothetical protein